VKISGLTKGMVVQAVREPGSKVTLAQAAGLDRAAGNRGSIRHAGNIRVEPDGRAMDPTRFIPMVSS